MLWYYLNERMKSDIELLFFKERNYLVQHKGKAKIDAFPSL